MMRTWPPDRCHVGDAEASDMERSGDERAVTPSISESRNVVRPADAAAGQQCQRRCGRSHASDHPEVESRAGADAREVDHDHSPDPGGGGARGKHLCRLVGRNAAGHAGRLRKDDRLAVAQVETEGDAVTANGRADLSERVVGGERLEPDDDVRGTEAKRMARLIDGRDAGIQPKRCAARGDCGDERVLRLAAENRIEVGNVQLGKAELVHIPPRERQRVTRFDGRATHGPHRSVALASSGAGVHSASGAQVHDADHSHGGFFIVSDPA